jgi:tetratricopeptide (TPR) repeat protein
MRALAASGDRSGALAWAKRYRAKVHRELSAEPDPSILKLEGAIRAAPVPREPAPTPVPEVPRPATPSAPAPEPLAVVARPERKLPRWLAPVALGVIVALGLGLRQLTGRAHASRPFLAVGAIRTPELGDTSSVGPMLRDMLATSLGGLEGLQVVANSRLVELAPLGDQNLPGAITNAARRAGATELLEGELASEAGALVLTLRRVDLGRGIVRHGYVVRAGNRYALIDSAAAMLARDLGLTPPSLTVRDVRTTSPEAYALYNEGLRAYYGYDAPAAYRLMTAALERDSSFAMAAYYSWEIGRWLGDEPATRQAFERAKRLAPRAIERERLLIQAATAGLDAPVSVAVAIAETLTVRYPTDPDGQILLGQLRYNQGDWPGSIAAYQRAVAIDSAAEANGPYCRICLALGYTTTAYIWWDSAGAAERVAKRSVRHRPDDPVQWTNSVEPLLRQGRRAEAELAVEKSGMAARWDPSLDRDLIRWGRLEELDRKLLPDLLAPSVEVKGNARWLLLISLRDQGRLREALALAQLSRLPGSSRTIPGLGPDPIFTAILLQELGRPDSAARFWHADARHILASPDMPRGLQARMSTWHLALAGTAYAAAGDTAVAHRLADSIEVLGKGSTFGRDLTLHHFLRGLVLQQAGRHAEAVDQLRASIFSLTDGYTRANLALAKSLLVLRRPAESIAVLRPAIHGGVDGSNTYVSRTELQEALALAFEQASQADSARAHWQAVESAWRHADQEFRERYLTAKRKARL